MSRGIGILQRHLLDRLATVGDPEIAPLLAARGYVSSPTLARSIREAEPTRSERVSVQRAIRTLEARGLVEIERQGGRKLLARLPVNDPGRQGEITEAEAVAIRGYIVARARAGYSPSRLVGDGWPAAAVDRALDLLRAEGQVTLVEQVEGSLSVV